MNYNYDSGLGFGYYFFIFLVGVFSIVSLWKIFVKAGKPGWASIVPIYNILVELEIIGRPWYWILLMLIPIVNIVIAVMIMFDMAKAFGKGTGFGLGLVFFSVIFLGILAFGDAKYLGPITGQPTAYTSPPPSSQL